MSEPNHFIFNQIEEELGMVNRVFSIQVIRPFLGFDVETSYRSLRTKQHDEYESIKTSGDKAMLKTIERSQKKERTEFFDGLDQGSDVFSFSNMIFSFTNFQRFLSSIYNRVVTKLFAYMLVSRSKEEQKGGIEKIIKTEMATPFEYKGSRYTLMDYIPDGRYSEFITGLSRKLTAQFSPSKKRDYLIGKASIPNAKQDLPIPFYRSAVNGTLVNFFAVDYDNKRLVGYNMPRDDKTKFEDYVVRLRVPVLHQTEAYIKKQANRAKKMKATDGDGTIDANLFFLDQFDKIEFKDVDFIISSYHLLKRVRDGSTNKIIKEFIGGTVVDKVKAFITQHEEQIAAIIKEGRPGDDMQDVIDKAVAKWTGISSYEIVKKRTKFARDGAWFFDFSYIMPPRKTMIETNDHLVAGIDACFSKDKIFVLKVIDTIKYREDPQDVGAWGVKTLVISDKDYHLRSLYNDYYTALRSIQRSKARARRGHGDRMPIVATRFNNKRKYLIGCIVRSIAKTCENEKVSKVFVENLDGLREGKSWFSINKISKFPIKGMFEKLKSKLAEAGIGLVDVGAANTSRTCPACGMINDGFTFDYRMENDFPIFTCIKDGCRYAKPEPTSFEKYLRGADINAAANIAIRGADIAIVPVKPKAKKNTTKKDVVNPSASIINKFMKLI